ncbi:hypothetical protein HDU96_003460 [Phlyctochytrium bullatum]|nr:hypothetical protein HDU96_003460 [Phlyctochytrium bullatum]
MSLQTPPQSGLQSQIVAPQQATPGAPVLSQRFFVMITSPAPGTVWKEGDSMILKWDLVDAASVTATDPRRAAAAQSSSGQKGLSGQEYVNIVVNTPHDAYISLYSIGRKAREPVRSILAPFASLSVKRRPSLLRAAAAAAPPSTSSNVGVPAAGQPLFLQIELDDNTNPTSKTSGSTPPQQPRPAVAVPVPASPAFLTPRSYVLKAASVVAAQSFPAPGLEQVARPVASATISPGTQQATVRPASPSPTTAVESVAAATNQDLSTKTTGSASLSVVSMVSFNPASTSAFVPTSNVSTVGSGEEESPAADETEGKPKAPIVTGNGPVPSPLAVSTIITNGPVVTLASTPSATSGFDDTVDSGLIGSGSGTIGSQSARTGGGMDPTLARVIVVVGSLFGVATLVIGAAWWWSRIRAAEKKRRVPINWNSGSLEA